MLYKLFQKLTNFFVRFVQRYMPDPFLYALLLTFLVVILIYLLVPGAKTTEIMKAWYDGVWGSKNIFTFALQMAFILIGGSTLAQAPLIKKGLRKIAQIPQDQVQAAILVFLVGAIGSFINWGLGLVIGTIIAKEIAKRLHNIDFGYVVAAAYMGFVVWASGISSSIVLATADPESSLNIIKQMTDQVVGIEHTVFPLYNIVPVLLTLVVMPFVLKLIAPTNIRTVDPKVLIAEDEAAAAQERAFAQRERTFATVIENAWIINLIIVIIGFYLFFVQLKAQITLNSMIMLFFLLGMLFHWTPIRFIRAFIESAKASGAILLQFPFFGGIMALLAYSPAQEIEPLQTVLAKAFVQAANAETLPFLNFLASNFIHLFVPSGGGHWAVQGPISIQAALELGQDSPEYLGKIAMSVAFGEQVANMVQPFWVLPVIALAKLTVRDVMGYTVMAMLVTFVLFGASLLIF